jgi:hypothetical protein
VQLDDWVLTSCAASTNKKGGLVVAAADHKPVFGHAAVSSPQEQTPCIRGRRIGVRGPGTVLRRRVVRLHMPLLHADSSCSGQVLSPERQLVEEQSKPKSIEWDRTIASDDPINPACHGTLILIIQLHVEKKQRYKLLPGDRNARNIQNNYAFI